MAGSARYTVILDACVLYPALIRDVLLSLAHADLYSARWSRRIRDEWITAKLREHPQQIDRLKSAAQAMEDAIPDCLVEGYEPLTEVLWLPDPDDRHVLAAAIVGHADAIVTLNLKDFPTETLGRHGIEVQHPDEFVLNQLMLDELRALAALKTMRLRWQNPAMDARAMVALMEQRGLVQTAARLLDPRPLALL